jgi:hypothetical protein
VLYKMTVIQNACYKKNLNNLRDQSSGKKAAKCNI